ncbi:ImuA family protein [Rhizobium sp. L1K21]|uniref:ImuA family protein n=1 Tax=Rhizobium sp. L1K21 TaxID=2954933 RepID=UPI0020927AA0|nr:hypothetical protein [Rhizobium sp. L1K21]MCO6184818.1 hypothetical protein [Rhizobium sp. L1K21]
MAQPALAKGTLCALRQTIARIEAGQSHTETLEARGENPRLPLGVEAFDEALSGGLMLSGLNELRAPFTTDCGAASGFALALSTLALERRDMPGLVLWIGEAITGREAGYPHAAGLLNLGFEPANLIYATPRKMEDALWICETALEVSAFAAVILEIRGNPARFGLAESRRLHLRARASRMPLFLLRQAGEEEASSAHTRLRIEPAAAAERLRPDGVPMSGTIGRPRFAVTIEKSRNPAPLTVLLEWNAHERQFSLARTARPSRALEPALSRTPLSASAERPDRAQTVGSIVAFERAS